MQPDEATQTPDPTQPAAEQASPPDTAALLAQALQWLLVAAGVPSVTAISLASLLIDDRLDAQVRTLGELVPQEIIGEIYGDRARRIMGITLISEEEVRQAVARQVAEARIALLQAREERNAQAVESMVAKMTEMFSASQGSTDLVPTAAAAAPSAPATEAPVSTRATAKEPARSTEPRIVTWNEAPPGSILELVEGVPRGPKIGDLVVRWPEPIGGHGGTWLTFAGAETHQHSPIWPWMAEQQLPWGSGFRLKVLVEGLTSKECADARGTLRDISGGT